jgi:hypothetical protein
MERLVFSSARFFRLPVAILTIVGVVGIDAVAAPLSGATARTSDSCTTIVLGRGGFGALQGCRSFGRDLPKENERNGSGQIAPGSGSTATISWTPPFEGSTIDTPAVVGLANVTFIGTESDNDSKAKSCPAGTFELEMKADVVSGDDAGGTFSAELCTSSAGAFPFTEEPHTKATITEP